MRFSMRLTEFHADRRLLNVQGGRSRGDQHKVCHRNSWLDQLDPGRPGVDKHPLPALTDEKLNGLGRGVDLEQLWVLHLASPRPPAGEALLRIKIQQRDASALFCSAYRKCTREGGFADAALEAGQRDN